MTKRSKKQRAMPKISATALAQILDELDAWCRHERSGKLTWQRLEEFAGFSRQSLSSHDDIKQRYDAVKALGRNGQVPRIAKAVDEQVAALRREIADLKGVIGRFDERWARYALNAARQGWDIERLDKPIDPPARAVVRVVRSKY